MAAGGVNLKLHHYPRLKKRTLTNLYNEWPTWLRLAYEQLDRAIVAAYAATDPAGGWSEDWAAVRAFQFSSNRSIRSRAIRAATVRA